MSETALETRLDALIDAIRAVAVKAERDRLVDVDGAAELLAMDRRYFAERVACQPGFPAPVRPKVAGSVSRPRWFVSDLLQWARDQQRERGRK